MTPNKQLYIVSSTDTDYIIVNIVTLRTKKIGRRGNGRGVNYADRARDEATRRNGGIRAVYLDKWELADVMKGARSIEHIYDEEQV